MSQMQELYEKVSKDTALEEKFSVIMKAAEKAGEDTKENLKAFAKDAGYDVTFEEMQTFFKALAEKGDGELTETELDMVAGGKATYGVFASFFLFGIGCAILSVMFAADQDATTCKDAMNSDL